MFKIHRHLIFKITAEAEALADRLYAIMPNLRITSLLAEVDRWTGFASAFTHLHSGAPAEDGGISPNRRKFRQPSMSSVRQSSSSRMVMFSRTKNF